LQRFDMPRRPHIAGLQQGHEPASQSRHRRTESLDHHETVVFIPGYERGALRADITPQGEQQELALCLPHHRIQRQLQRPPGRPTPQ
jgi:hypothetical protein